MEKNNWVMIKRGVTILMIAVFWSMIVICQGANKMLNPTPPITPLSYELQKGQLDIEVMGWGASFEQETWQSLQLEADWSKIDQWQNKLLNLKEVLVQKSQRVVSLWESTMDSWEEESQP